MSFTKNFLFISGLVLLISFALHELYPIHISWFMQFPIIKSAISSVHSYSKYIRSFLENDVKPEKLNIVKSKSKKLFTSEELKKYDGTAGKKGPYIALMGKVYDVKKGKQHYGEGGGYSFFAGRDASRAYVSGDFEEKGLISDISNLTSQDYLGLEGWEQFYMKDYRYVGKLIGLYYDENGELTEYNHMVQRWISEAHASKDKDNEDKKIFPNCNSKWTQETGSEVWCTSKSGGVERGWVGVPRKYFSPGKKGARCACVRNMGPPYNAPDSKSSNGDLDNPKLEEFENCPPNSITCKIPIPKD